MDQATLVAGGTKVLRALKSEGVKVAAALWVCDPDEHWSLWVAPDRFISRMDFYSSLAAAIAKHTPKSSYFDIADVKVIEPNEPVVAELRKFGRVRAEHPVALASARLGNTFVAEGLLLQVG